MKKTILFCLNPGLSHFLPTISYAKLLMEHGYEIIYLGFSNLEDVVRSEGFTYISIKSVENESVINKLKDKYKFQDSAKIYKNIVGEIKDVIRQYNVSLMIFDVGRFNLFFLPAIESNIPSVSFWTCSGATNINFNVPPNSSHAIPCTTNKYSILSGIRWMLRYVRREFYKHKTLISKFYYPHTEIKKYVKKSRLKWQYNINGLYLNVPKIVLGPAQFEFPNTPEDNLTYLGLCIDEDRKVRDFYWRHYDDTKPLIYCSLGTLSNRYEYSEAFFEEIIKTFKEKPEWQVIINTGNLSSVDRFLPLPDNIFMSNYVPQLEVLKKASLMLTHGGYGTIKECIALSVPMIVFPCIYDQPGNAARVDFHKIGVRRDISKITSTEIEKVIKEMLTNKEYKENINKLRDEIIANNSLEEGVFLINSLLTKPK
ncbi:glycosyltransferase [Bacillus mycoides]|uniref:MGT family glycosyltransferase n=1 Tax=Bacillus mycoides TaxID=1405 RepID=A0A1S9T0X9_BACMY|nr:glycosyltransferase [Bacillus mycoides]OOR03664.1 hypothetical protein BW900_25870 [Bacillus mycoides]